MKKVLITCVNFNSYDVLYNYIDSIDIAASKVINNLSVTIAVADNTYNNYKEINKHTKYCTLTIFPYHKNYGYMGGAVQILKDMGRAQVLSYDFIFVSNVDISLSEDFFVNLLKTDTTNVGWIAPSILRNIDGSNENPFIVNELSKSQINFYILLYSCPILYGIYQKLSKKIHTRKYLFRNGGYKKCDIYAGMGSIFIFTREFIEKNYPLSFPTFMYGEEIYYGYLVKTSGLKTIYEPSITVFDICGVSTGLLGLNKKCKMNKQSLKIIRDIMYK